MAEAKENLWEGILESVSQKSSRLGRGSNHKLKNIIVLGDEGVGKTSTLNQLLSKKVGKDSTAPLGTGLSFTYLDVREEDSDDIVDRIGVYTVDGGVSQTNLLPVVLNADTVAHVMALIVVDLSRPWTIIDSLKRWSSVITDHIDGLGLEGKLDQLKEEQVHAFRSYVEPEESSQSSEGEPVLLDLDEGTLTSNTGIPILVIGAKDDSVEALSESRDYKQEHFDFIQMHIRKFCLQHGAGLLYTGKEKKNKETLYRYLLHVAGGYPFAHKAQLAEVEGLFIPRGWDNPTKVQVLSESFSKVNEDDQWDEVIKEISGAVGNTGPREVIADDEQRFLDKQRALLSKDPPAGGSGGGSEPPNRDRAEKPHTKPVSSRPTKSTSNTLGDELAAGSATPAKSSKKTDATAFLAQMAAQKKRTPASGNADRAARPKPTGAKTGAAGGGGEGKNAVLANFFNSLLATDGSKKPPAKRDAAAVEAEKMKGKADTG